MALQNPLLPTPQAAQETLSPAASAGLAPTDIQRVDRFLDDSASENTRASYSSAWKSFNQWAGFRSALAMPASPTLVAAYLSHLVEERHFSVATVRLHRAALAAIHKAIGHKDPTENEGVRRLMQGISRAHGRAQRQAKPLTAEELAAVKATANGLRSRGARRQAPGVGREGLMVGKGGRGPAVGAQGRAAPALGG